MTGITVEEARAVFARRIDAWLAEDVDAYVACWHDDMRIEMPTGVIEGAAKYRKLVIGSFAWAAPLSFEVHHLAVDDETGVVFADWTIRARRREDAVTVEWRRVSEWGPRDGRVAAGGGGAPPPPPPPAARRARPAF